jgi:hypothetical protein
VSKQLVPERILEPSGSTQADNHNSICFEGRRWGRIFAEEGPDELICRSSELLSVLIITHVSKHDDVLTSSPWEA